MQNSVLAALVISEKCHMFTYQGMPNLTNRIIFSPYCVCKHNFFALSECINK